MKHTIYILVGTFYTDTRLYVSMHACETIILPILLQFGHGPQNLEFNIINTVFIVNL